MDKSKNNSKKKLLISIAVILLLALLAVGGVVVYNSFFTEKPPESTGVVGRISPDWDSGIEQEASSQPEVGIQIPGYGTAEMNSGDTSLHLSIGNPESNECAFYATLRLEDGTVLYESELLKPGYGLTDIPLSQTLEPGEYTAVVSYRCVTLDEEHKPLNSAESELVLIVK